MRSRRRMPLSPSDPVDQGSVPYWSRDARRLLGLARGASAAEVEQRRRELVAWLTSPAVPQSLRPWAEGQARMVEQSAALLLASSPEASRQRRRGRGETPRAATSRFPFLRRTVLGPAGYVSMALVVGVVILVALLWKEMGSTPARRTPEFTLQEGGGVVDEAQLARLKAAAVQNPNDPTLLFDIAETYMTGDRWAEAIEWFTRYRKLDPENLHAQVDIGIASMSLGLYDQAEEMLQGVLAKDPGNVQVHYSLGFLYASLPTPSADKAKQHWEEVIRLAPDSSFAENARVHLLEGNPGG
ncbi:MAG: tetratricopeptide repeat protein [Chloroflexi bacterium]|nr:tetratricopeptide repeat protein [Chloroflexota bacterium]